VPLDQSRRDEGAEGLGRFGGEALLSLDSGRERDLSRPMQRMALGRTESEGNQKGSGARRAQPEQWLQLWSFFNQQHEAGRASACPARSAGRVAAAKREKVGRNRTGSEETRGLARLRCDLVDDGRWRKAGLLAMRTRMTRR